MKAYCYTKSGGDVAAWEVAGTSEDDNGTIFLCKVNTADDKIGYLYVYGMLLAIKSVCQCEQTLAFKSFSLCFFQRMIPTMPSSLDM